MPLTPSNGDKHAAPLIRLYRLLELALWRILAKLLGLERGWGRRWLTRMLMRLPNFRQATRRIVDDTADQAPGLVATAINRAWRDGTRAARADTGSHTEHFDDDAVQDIINRVLDGLDTAHRGVLADTENIYRRVVDEVARDPNIAGDNELATLLREALQRNARFGFVATTDQRGRRRELVAYAEQQIRAGVTAAEVDGFCAQALADGNDLFIVSDVPGACRLCAPFEGRVISITGTTVGAITRDTHTGRPVPVNVMCSLAEARARGLFHYGCVLPDTEVLASGGIVASDVRRYEGEIIVIHTASALELSITPNHPVLTSKGWVRAGDLVVGDNVARDRLVVEPVVPSSPDNDNVPSRISEIHEAFRCAVEVRPPCVPTSAEEFHGDGGNSEVEIIRADSLLLDHLQPLGTENGGEFALLVGSHRHRVLSRNGLQDPLSICGLPTLGGSVRSGVLSSPLFCRHGRPLATLGFAPGDPSVTRCDDQTDRLLRGIEGSGQSGLGLAGLVALDDKVLPPSGAQASVLGFVGLDPSLVETLPDDGLADVEGNSDLPDGFPGCVAFDQIVDIKRNSYVGQVHNLETGDGRYTANGIIVHNCRHTIKVWTPDNPAPPAAVRATPEQQEVRQQARTMQRRNWVRRRFDAIARHF